MTTLRGTVLGRIVVSVLSLVVPFDEYYCSRCGDEVFVSERLDCDIGAPYCPVCATSLRRTLEASDLEIAYDEVER